MSDTSVEIWVVDDDPDVALHLALVAERAGYDATIETFPRAADVHDLDHAGRAPDLVLVDQLLPDGRGSTLLRELHRLHPTAIVRLITAAPDEIDDVDRAIGVVAKPPSVEVIGALLEQRRH